MLNNYCTDYALAGILYVFQRIINIIQIIVPIILLISVSIWLIQVIINPDEKKNLKKLYNMVIAAVVVFFVPMLVNMILGMIDSNNNFIKCWRDAKNISFNINNNHHISSGREAVRIVNDQKYEQGDDKKNG